MNANTEHYRARVWAAVVASALPHRRLGAWTAARLAEFQSWRERLGAWPFLTHCSLARMRCRKHRNTTRAILAELVELGFVTAYAYRTGRGIRYKIAWGRVLSWAKSHAIKPMTGEAMAGERSSARTKADWDAERAAYHAAREARKAAELARAIQDRKAQGEAHDAALAAMSPAEKQARHNRILALSASLRGHHVRPAVDGAAAIAALKSQLTTGSSVGSSSL